METFAPKTQTPSKHTLGKRCHFNSINIILKTPLGCQASKWKKKKIKLLRKHHKSKITLILYFSARATEMKQGIIISGILEERTCAPAFCLSRLLNKLTQLELSNILTPSSSIKDIKLTKDSLPKIKSVIRSLKGELSKTLKFWSS